jgi:hypothetical protein
MFSGLRRRIVADNENLAPAVTGAWAGEHRHVRPPDPAASDWMTNQRQMIKGPTAADSDQALDLLLR